MNTVAILAGGVGARAGADGPKQFLDMCGKTLLERTIAVFEAHPRIDRIVVVSHPDYVAKSEEIRIGGGYCKWDTTVPGGAERYLSSVAAVEACGNDNGNILIHDAARPFVSPQLIDRLLDALTEVPAAIPVIPLSDTLLEVENECVKCAHNRNKFRLAQTPQAFRLADFRLAAIQAKQDINICVTDDCGLFQHYFPLKKIKTIDGGKENKKLTYHSDIEDFIKIFKENNCKGLHD